MQRRVVVSQPVSTIKPLRPLPSGAKIIALMNFKGGVGKTTCAVNIAATLRHTLKYRVLLVDLDPQCSASLWLMKRDVWFQLAHEKLNVCRIFRQAIIGKTITSDGLIQCVAEYEGRSIDLIPSVIDLLEIEAALTPRMGNYHNALSQAIWPLRDQYDFILLDCPPAFSTVTKNGLFAADHIIVPYLPDHLSLPGLQWLARLNRTFQEHIQARKPNLVTAELIGIIFNAFDARLNLGPESLAQLQETLDQLIQMELVPAAVKIFEPTIHRDTKLTEAPGAVLPITAYAPGSRAAKEFTALTQNIIKTLTL